MTSVEKVQWKAPSGRASASGENKQTADLLRTRQGEWAIIEETVLTGDPVQDKKIKSRASNRASLITSGRTAAFTPHGTYQAASRSKNEVNDAGEPVMRVYAVYLGEEYAIAKEDENADSVASDDVNDDQELAVSV